jgi:hypothetical protein
MLNILSYAGYYTNYNIINQDNLYKFLYISLQALNIEEQKKYVDNINLIMGQTFTKSFKWYIFSKFENDPLLKLL